MYGFGKVEPSTFEVAPAMRKGIGAMTVPVARLSFSHGSGGKIYSNLSFWSWPFDGADRGKAYRLRFKARSGPSGMRVSFILRTAADTILPGSLETFFRLDGELREYELLVSPNVDVSTLRPEFQIFEDDIPRGSDIAGAFVEIADAEFHEAWFRDIAPRTFYRFEENPSGEEREMDLPGPWIDVWQRPVTGGRVRIPPHSGGCS